MDELKRLISDLCGICTVTGSEADADESVLPVQSFDRYEKDRLGNRFFYRYSKKENAPMMVIDAHFDEVGFIVTEILENGFVRSVKAGSPDMRAVSASTVTIYGKEPVFAVATSTPPHLRTGTDNSVVRENELMFDTGLSEARARELIRPGDRVCFSKRARDLKNGRFMAQGLDNKACAAIALYSAVSVPADEMEYSVCVLLSSGEEGGCMGAVPASKSVKPDLTVVLDAGFGRNGLSDTPRCIAMGKGPAISYSSALDRALTEKIIMTASDNSLPLQVIVENFAPGTNSEFIQHFSGVPSALISLPLFNMHSSSEIISIPDAHAASDLIAKLIRTPDLAAGGEKQ